jgi:hypothetical protein
VTADWPNLIWERPGVAHSAEPLADIGRGTIGTMIALPVALPGLLMLRLHNDTRGHSNRFYAKQDVYRS